MNDSFPLVCEGCLGDTAFVKMIRGGANAGTCRMCLAPYTQYSWKTGKSGFNKTEVCHGCSTVKNLCQTCLKDLKFGLPSQLRDAVLHASEKQAHINSTTANTSFTLDPNASEAQQRYYMQQQLSLVESGNVEHTAGHSASDKLLRIARAAMEGREKGSGANTASSRNVAIALRVAPLDSDTAAGAGTGIGGKRAREGEGGGSSGGDDGGERFDFLLPEGYHANAAAIAGAGASAGATSSSTSANASGNTSTHPKKKGKGKAPPPLPPGPPPPNAFEA